MPPVGELGAGPLSPVRITRVQWDRRKLPKQIGNVDFLARHESTMKLINLNMVKRIAHPKNFDLWSSHPRFYEIGRIAEGFAERMRAPWFVTGFLPVVLFAW